MKAPVILRARKKSTDRDSLGRKHCSKGEKCIHPDGPWLEETEFRRNRTALDGLQWQCKTCGKQWKEMGQHPRYCRICGEECAKGHGPQLCKEHKEEGKRKHRRTQGGYIVVSRGENPEWYGGWFSGEEMKALLADGVLPEGTRLNQMRSGSVLRTVRVAGEQLTQQTLEEQDG